MVSINDYGIYGFDSKEGKIEANIVSRNNIGICLARSFIWNWNFNRLEPSIDNEIMHNNFLQNENQAIDSRLWTDYSDYDKNYWSDYDGVDLNGNGYGDEPYIIGYNTGDDHPLMEPFNITIPLNPEMLPVVNVSYPIPDSKLSGTVEINGTAFTPEGTLQKIEIKIDDGDWVQVIGTNTWEYYWDTTQVSNGPHKIYLRAFNGSDYSPEENITIIVDNPLPSSEKQFFNELWFWVLISIVIVIIIIFLSVSKRNQKKK